MKTLRKGARKTIGGILDTRFNKMFLESYLNFMPPTMCLHCNHRGNTIGRPPKTISLKVACEYCIDTNREPVPWSELK